MTICNFRKIIYLLLAFCTVGCSSPKESYERVENVPMLGTFLNIIADIPADSLTPLYNAAMALDKEMKAQMSIFDSTSLISRINRGERLPLTEDIIYNIHMADSISRLSGGVYDITVLPLVEAWGFGRKGAVSHPNVDSLLEFVGYQKIAIEDGYLTKQDPRTRLDFNSIAKGYTVDKLAEIVVQMGGENYLVDIGGEINCTGVNPQGEGWRVGIESPIDGDMSGEHLQKRLRIEPQSVMRGVATSGNYRRFYIGENGEKICHTIDPRTGLSKPSRLLSATVVARTCALADGYATMFMAAGSEFAIELAQSIEDIEVYFILSGEGETEYQEFSSEGMKRIIMKN